MFRIRSSRLMRRAAAITVGAASVLSFGSMSTAHAITLDPAAVSGYWLDSAGGLHPFASGTSVLAPAAAAISFYNGNSARGVVSLGALAGGFVLGKDGSLNRFGIGSLAIPAAPTNPQVFPGADVARGVGLLPSKTGGYWLDSAGGLHPFGLGGNAAPAAATITYYNANSAKAVVMTPNGKGGFVVDNGGSMHPFHVGPVTVEDPMPAAATNPQTFGTADVVSGVVTMADGLSGYWLDSAGGLHPFALPGGTAPAAAALSFYKGGSARGAVMAGDGKGGYVLDDGGSLHAFAVGPVTVTNPMPPVATNLTTFGTADVARGITSV